MATHSSVLAWRVPGTGEPGGLPSLGSHRVGHDSSDLAAAAAAAGYSVALLTQDDFTILGIYYYSVGGWIWIVNFYQFSSVAQSCPTPRDPIDGSPPGSPVPGTLQARTLEWVAISFSNA